MNTNFHRGGRGHNSHSLMRMLLFLVFIGIGFIYVVNIYVLTQYHQTSTYMNNDDQSNFILQFQNDSISSNGNSLKDNTIDSNRMMNVIQIENQLSGSPEWILSSPALNREVEGYMSKSSINKGQSIKLFYSVNEPNLPTDAMVSIEVFRSGWYQGIGGRKLLGPINVPPIAQEMPSFERDGLLACKWKDPFILNTESSWTSGVYLVKMTLKPAQVQSYAIFVVRDDDRKEKADIMLQLPFNTYQAYNIWGGKNIYRCNLSKRCEQARMASFDRPYAAPDNKAGAFGTGAGEYLSNVQPFETYPIKTTASWNYNMVRWMEKNGLDVTYVANADVHSRLPRLMKPRVFMTQGHDEYWSWAMRDHVMAWRDEGVHLAFLGSNTAYWQIRYEDSDGESSLETDNTNTESRTMVCYRREKKDPIKTQYRTTKWRLVRPEALLVGVEYLFPLGDPFDEDMLVSNYEHWMFKNTGVKKGDALPGLLGYEVDRIQKESLVPKEGNLDEPVKNIVELFATPLINRKNNKITSHGAIYQASSGAYVFSPGTMQWSWGLDDYGVEQGLRTSRLNSVVETMTWNFLEAAGIKRR